MHIKKDDYAVAYLIYIKKDDYTIACKGLALGLLRISVE